MIITTLRLILRELTPADAESFCLLNADPEVIRYTGDAAFADVEEAKNFLEGYDHYEKYGFGRWAVIRREDNEFLGWCGLKYTPETDEYDIGFRFFKKYWKQGYATEAAQASLDYGLNDLKIKTIIGRAIKANTASIKVLEKIGMTYWKSMDFHGGEGVVYRIENKISASYFFKIWIETVTERKDHLLSIWRNNTEYTKYIKGSENSLLGEIAKKLNLLCYEKDYYSLDAIFYKMEDKTPGINPNTFWFHNIRIGFEHENHFNSGLYQEVSHLLIIDCELKVLVTYPNENTTVQLKYLHKIISSNQRAKYISENESFLIIFGYENNFVWEGYIYKTDEWLMIN